MGERKNSGGSLPGADVVVTRVFSAGPERVFEAWTTPGLLQRWWGPKDFTAPVCKVDLKKGGKYHFCMRSPEGRDYWSTGVYREIEPPNRLVMSDSFADEKGNVVPAAHYGMGGNWPMEMLVKVTFEDREGGTKMTLVHSVGAAIPSQDLENMKSGWSQSFDKLAEVVEKE